MNDLRRSNENVETPRVGDASLQTQPSLSPFSSPFHPTQYGTLFAHQMASSDSFPSNFQGVSNFSLPQQTAFSSVDGLPSPYIQQAHFPALRAIAPKPLVTPGSNATLSSGSKPPDFIETVKEIRQDLFTRSGVAIDDQDKQDPPVLESSEYTKWRRTIKNRWAPVSNTSYCTTQLIDSQPEHIAPSVFIQFFIVISDPH